MKKQIKDIQTYLNEHKSLKKYLIELGCPLSKVETLNEELETRLVGGYTKNNLETGIVKYYLEGEGFSLTVEYDKHSSKFTTKKLLSE